ncbi:DUF664 domain-containing protein [Nonomuraea sp. NPDC003804]|uniref:mycothiol transferase n=1 Tax=Nonomuraea sp. NPDC003804 TaxID=3154547 RepID=UPI0033A88777
MTDPRIDPPAAGDERELLVAFLDWHRETLAVKCADLSEVEECRKVSAGTPLDALARRDRRGDHHSHRYILIHMIEEYARHNGHADLLRERIDGTTGE